MVKLFNYIKIVFYTSFFFSCHTYNNVPIQSNLFVGEEIQTLNNGLLLQYVNSKQAGISKKRKNHLLVLKITNPTDSSIHLIPSKFQIRNSKGENREIINPFLKTKKINRDGVVSINYILNEYRFIVEKIEVKRNFPMILETGGRTNAEGAAAIGTANLLIEKMKQPQKKKRFESVIFLKDIKPKETLFGWLLISGVDDEQLFFQIR